MGKKNVGKKFVGKNFDGENIVHNRYYVAKNGAINHICIGKENLDKYLKEHENEGFIGTNIGMLTFAVYMLDSVMDINIEGYEPFVFDNYVLVYAGEHIYRLDIDEERENFVSFNVHECNKASDEWNCVGCLTYNEPA